MNINIELKNGKLLRGFIQPPGDNPSGIIAFIHGIGEHMGRYSDWADRFNKENYAFVGFDLPGHGKSDGERGKITSYKVVHEMIDIMLKTISRTYPGVPVWLYGHSLGGGIVLDYAIRFNPSVKGIISTSPWIRLSFEPSVYKILLASVVKSFMPGLLQNTGLKTNYLSHDQSVVDRYVSDPLVHDKITVGFFSGAISSSEYILKNAFMIKGPVLVVHGSDDMICSPDGSREFASKTDKAELKIWKGGFHELHNEPFKQEVFNFIIGWIKQKSTKK
ncbi:MAG TPA: alpha/beta hydrolase [Bacteroidales bacterium]|nr:alpha/beta hydrolase [Bacteroidales bacterium]